MAFSSDAPAFLADLGDSVSWTPSAGGPAVVGLMIVDGPDIDIASGEVLSRDYQVTFETAAWPGLVRDEQLVIQGDVGRGGTFKLRTNPLERDDAVFSAAKLTKVA